MREARASRLTAILAAIVVGWASCLSAEEGAEEEDANPLERTVALAQQSELWRAASTAADRLHAIREVAKTYDIVSDPVSDRYLITRYGGPIDLVHFLALAIYVASERWEFEEALMIQWRDEGGEDYEAGKTRTFPTEAHPDDLPSNALGALFGEEIRARNALSEEDFDVVAELRKFLEPLGIVEDEVAEKYSHRLVVMGLDENSSNELDTSRREWFTARPLFILPLVSPEEASSLRNAHQALRKAGFRVIPIEGREIGVARVVEKLKQ